MKKSTLIFAISVAAVSSQATVAFNTFGPGDTTKAFGWGFGDIRDARIASQFTSSVSGTLESFSMKLQRSTVAANATISLFQDSGNDIGSLISSYTTLVSAGGVTTFNNSDSSIQLIAGNKYWIEAKTATQGNSLYSGWSNNNQGVNGLIKFGAVLGSSQDPTSTYRVGPAELPAFRVNVTPVPEPSTLVGMALFSSFVALRRRKAN